MANIYAKRIPSGLGYVPSGTVRAHTVRGGLGGAESCGPTQQWDPNYVFNGIKGQCTPKGSPMTPAPKPGFWESFAAGLTSPFTKPAPAPAAAPVIIQQGGMSQNTMIAIGLGAVGLLAIVMLSRK